MRLLSLSFAVFLAALSLHAADPSPSPAEEKKEAEKPRDFDMPVPLGIPVKGIKIPHRDDSGKLVMTIEAEVATKLDEHHVEMENMKIESLDDDGKTMNIELPHSIFDLETRILSGDSRAVIHREDFNISGDTIEFHTKTRNATLRGKIHMIIQSANIEQ
jgi:hypothetical protein